MIKGRFLVPILQGLLGFAVIVKGSAWLSIRNPTALSTVLLSVFVLGFLGSLGILIYQRFSVSPGLGGRGHPAHLVLLGLSAIMLAVVTVSEASGVLLPKADLMFAVGIGLLLVGNLLFLRSLRRSPGAQGSK